MNNLKFPPIQFSLFRIIFGLYLFIHFICLIPLSPDIWSNQGMMADSSINFTFGKFPNVLNLFDSPLQIRIFVMVMTFLSLLIVVGYFRRIAAILLWFGWACLFHRNNLISNPGVPMIGWLLLALTLIPIGEPLSLAKKKGSENWFMPPLIFWGAWWIIGLAYTISGFDKLMSPSWQDGSAMIHLVNNPLARDWFVRDILLAMPTFMMHINTWLALVLELTFGFFCLFKKTRPMAWFFIMSMHLGILLVVDFADLTIGVMMIHFFTFDPQWFQPKSISGEKKVVLFDGVCGLCNGFINFLLANDLNHELYFSPLQGSFAKDKMDASAIEKMESVVFYYKGTKYTKSKAAILILRQLGGMWVFINLFLIIPKFMRDFLYDLIAKNRYKIFGKHETCRIPTPEERAHFID